MIIIDIEALKSYYVKLIFKVLGVKMPYQPQLIASEFLDKVSQASRNNQRDPFTINRLKKEAEKLLRVDAASAYMAMGAIAALEGNIGAIHENHKKAINLLHHSITSMNYAVSLQKVGYFSESIKIVQEIFSSYSDMIESEYVLIFINLYWSACRFHDAQKLIKRFNKINSSAKLSYANFIDAAVNFMDEKGITDSEFENLIGITMSTLHQHNIYVPNIDTFLSSEDGESTYFNYRVKINKPVNEVVELNFELDDRIVDECSDKIIKSHIVPMYIATDE